MGNVFSRKVLPKDELATIVEKIKNVDECVLQLHREKAKVSSFFLLSTIVAVLGIAIHFVLTHPNFRKEIVLGLVVLSTIIVYILCRFFIIKFYNWRTERQVNVRSILTQRRSEILKEIKEKVPFKEAREIILKYGTEEDLTSDDDNDRSPKTVNKTLNTTSVPSQRPPPNTPMPSAASRSGNPPNNPNQLHVTPPQTGGPPTGAVPPTPGSAKPPSALLPTPIRPYSGITRTPMEKIIDFVIGDGPNNRYALICKNCHAHNGMALPEEFPNLSFICFNCAFYNLSKRKREAEFPKPQLPEKEPTSSSSSDTPIRTSNFVRNRNSVTTNASSEVSNERENIAPVDIKND